MSKTLPLLFTLFPFFKFMMMYREDRRSCNFYVPHGSISMKLSRNKMFSVRLNYSFLFTI
jgi:hypothetical protein